VWFHYKYKYITLYVIPFVWYCHQDALLDLPDEIQSVDGCIVLLLLSVLFMMCCHPFISWWSSCTAECFKTERLFWYKADKADRWLIPHVHIVRSQLQGVSVPRFPRESLTYKYHSSATGMSSINEHSGVNSSSHIQCTAAPCTVRQLCTARRAHSQQHHRLCHWHPPP